MVSPRKGELKVKLKTKNMIVLVVVSLLLCSASAAIANAAGSLQNPGFETGDLTGWTTIIPSEGYVNVVTTYTSDERTVYLPPEGSYFAELKTDGPGSYTTLKQSFFASSGQTIYGWTAFDAQDYLPYNDNAMVRILDSSGVEIAQPWYSDVSSVGNYGETPWTSWSWTAPASGTYTVEFRLSNAGDSVLDSRALFDAALNCATVANVWTTDSAGNMKLIFDAGETVYLHWMANGNINLTVIYLADDSIDHYWLNLPESGVQSFVPANGAGYYGINATACVEQKRIACGSYLILPEYELGALFGLISCFAGFVVFKSKRKL